MRTKRLVFTLAIALGISVLPALAAEGANACAVTTVPNPPFVPPSPFTVFEDSATHFAYGTPGLWAFVFTRWKLGGWEGNKLPYFSVNYDWKTEKTPQMTVEAKRLDADGPVVLSERVIGAGASFRYGEAPDLTKPGATGAMITALHIPAAGCWEISAVYKPKTGSVQKMSYTILVEP
jgi:hypothetical protein